LEEKKEELKKLEEKAGESDMPVILEDGRPKSPARTLELFREFWGTDYALAHYAATESAEGYVIASFRADPKGKALTGARQVTVLVNPKGTVMHSMDMPAGDEITAVTVGNAEEIIEKSEIDEKVKAGLRAALEKMKDEAEIRAGKGWEEWG
jgi:hypothetical protein